MLFPPRWFSLGLWDRFAPVDLVRSVVTAWQNCSAAPACEPHQTDGGFPEHFRRATLQLIPTRSLPPLFKANAPCPTKSWHASSKIWLRAPPWARFGSPAAHLSTTRLYVLKKHSLSTSSGKIEPPIPPAIAGVQNVGDQPSSFLRSPASTGSPGLATLACSCSRHRRSSTRTLPR